MSGRTLKALVNQRQLAKEQRKACEVGTIVVNTSRRVTGDRPRSEMTQTAPAPDIWAEYWNERSDKR